MTLAQRKNGGVQVGMGFFFLMVAPCCIFTSTFSPPESADRATPAATNSVAVQPPTPVQPPAPPAQPPEQQSADSVISPSPSGGRTVSVTVVVASKKSNGKAWDALGGAPDPAICVTTLSGKRCYPAAPSDSARVARGQCKNEFECVFNQVVVGDDLPRFEVFDADAASHDAVGQGDCAVGKTCVLGLATVTVAAP